MAPAPSAKADHWTSGAPKHLAAALLSLAAFVALGSSLLAPRLPMLRAEPATVGARIDLNAATAAELEALPRIGPALARRILEDREANGPFTTIESLDRVPGIGPRTIEQIRPFATIAPIAAGDTNPLGPKASD